jgi:AraC family transcriptional regulator of adaptative response/methylated-DNA-[protein]-cysteine methyltransferase
VAAHIHLSSAHFQRLFTEWVGTSVEIDFG